MKAIGRTFWISGVLAVSCLGTGATRAEAQAFSFGFARPGFSLGMTSGGYYPGGGFYGGGGGYYGGYPMVAPAPVVVAPPPVIVPPPIYGRPYYGPRGPYGHPGYYGPRGPYGYHHNPHPYYRR